MSQKTRCSSKTLKGQECSRYALTGKQYCKQHSAPKTDHPPFKLMIATAIIGEASRKGSSRCYIKKYLESNYQILPTNPFIKKTIKSMLDSGELIANPHHLGHFRVSPDFKL